MNTPSPLALHGIGVLVTRPEQQAAALSRLLHAHGAASYLFPALIIAEHPRRRDTVSQLKAARDFDLIIFVSANAVRFGVVLLEDRRHIELAAVGPATARALNSQGHRVSVIPNGGFDSEHLLAHPQLLQLQGKRVLLVKGSEGRDFLEQELLRRGAHVDLAIVYERRAASPSNALLQNIEQHFMSNDIQLITATSVEIANQLFALAHDRLHGYFCSAVWVVPSERVVAAIAQLSTDIKVLRAASADDHDLVRAMLSWVSGA